PPQPAPRSAQAAHRVQILTRSPRLPFARGLSLSLAAVSPEAIEFIQQLINGLSLGAIYALIALGYTMVFGVLRFINFAHGDVFMLGGYAGWLFFAVPEDPSKTGMWASLSRSFAAMPPGL